MAYEPISDEDWEPMRTLAFEMAQIISEGLEGDDHKDGFEEKELRASFEAHLELLERKYGPHPWLLDIRADACEDPKERIRLRLSGIDLVEDNEADLKGQFYIDLVRDYLWELKDSNSAGIWLGKAKVLSATISDQSLLAEISELELEMSGTKLKEEKSCLL